MVSQTTSPAAPDPLAAMLQNATIDKAKGNEFSNSAGDMFKFVLNNYNFAKEGENPVPESSDAINHLIRTIPHFSAEVRKNDQSRSVVGETLPRELVERIFLLLDTESMLTCRLVNREFNEIIQYSTALQYFLACKAAGVIDNPQSPLSYNERLEALKKREAGWRTLKPVFEMTIDGIHQIAPSQCRLTEGVYFLPDENLKDLNYCHLTSFPQENPQWIRIPGHGPVLDWTGFLISFVAALYEHDLIVNFISSGIENQAGTQRHSFDLVLLKFPTGEYHPLARRPRIHVQVSPEVKPRVFARVVGDNLAFIVHSRSGMFSDKLFIFDWKTGHKRLQHKGTENEYSGLVFVSPELLLVPNRVLSHFEVWHLPSQELNPKPPIQILSLQLPTVSPEYTIFDFRCYGEPNPFLHSMPYLPPRPFFSSPENSTITVTLRMWSKSPQLVSYNIIMHRRALRDTIQAWTSPSLLKQQEYQPTWSTNEVTVHQFADPEDGSDQLDAQSKLISTKPHHPRSSPRTPTFAASQISADAGSLSVSSGLSTNQSTSLCTFLQVPWAKWGPSISRWFQVNGTHARWFNHSNGQRYAFSDPNPLDERKLMVSVVDFNPHNFKRNTEMMLRSGEGQDNRNNEEFEKLDQKDVFSEEIYMGLKCVVYCAPDEYDFDLVWMDEERLFGVKLGDNGWEESIKVLYIG